MNSSPKSLASAPTGRSGLRTQRLIRELGENFNEINAHAGAENRRVGGAIVQHVRVLRPSGLVARVLTRSRRISPSLATTSRIASLNALRLFYRVGRSCWRQCPLTTLLRRPKLSRRSACFLCKRASEISAVFCS
jgi:hypothetical protein